MGNRTSTLKEEIAVDVIVKVSAELNHQLLQHEAHLLKHDEQIMELNNQLSQYQSRLLKHDEQVMEDLRMLKATMLMHTTEIKVLHDTKKNIRVKRSVFWSSSSSSQKVHPQNKSERVS